MSLELDICLSNRLNIAIQAASGSAEYFTIQKLCRKKNATLRN